MQNVSMPLDLVLKGVALKVLSMAGYQACHMADQLNIYLENLEFLIDLKYVKIIFGPSRSLKFKGKC